jgi:rhodanese-related sulfurtransferase
VGRPDLTGATSTLTSRDLAGYMYDSLQSKIINLPKDTIVYPAHGAGSSCGKNIGKETFTTIGLQLEMNYALKAKSKEEFITLVIEGLNAPPPYFFADAAINKNGYKSIDNILAHDLRPLTSQQILLEIESGTTVLDVRQPDDYEKLNIQDSINIGLDGQFAIWAATLLPLTTPLVIVAPDGREQETIIRLARVGFDNVRGYYVDAATDMANGILKTQFIESIAPDVFVSQLANNIHILDVRNSNEQSSGVMPDAQLIDLSNLASSLQQLNNNTSYYVHCAGGYRSMIACSLLKKQGYNKVINVKGGMAKIKDQQGVQLAVPIS